jgi:transposase
MHRIGPSAHVVPSHPSSKQRLFGSARSGIAPSLRIASDLNIGEDALREWVQRAKIDAGNGGTGALTSDEREEFMRLRREHKRVLMDLEILEKATEYFARRSP